MAFFNKNNNKIAPNNDSERFINILRTLSEEDLQKFIQRAKSIGIPDNQIDEGIRIIRSVCQ